MMATMAQIEGGPSRCPLRSGPDAETKRLQELLGQYQMLWRKLESKQTCVRGALSRVIKQGEHNVDIARSSARFAQRIAANDGSSNAVRTKEDMFNKMIEEEASTEYVRNIAAKVETLCPPCPNTVYNAVSGLLSPSTMTAVPLRSSAPATAFAPNFADNEIVVAPQGPLPMRAPPRRASGWTLPENSVWPPCTWVGTSQAMDQHTGTWQPAPCTSTSELPRHHFFEASNAYGQSTNMLPTMACDAKEAMPADLPTTVCVRNIPQRYIQEDLLQEFGHEDMDFLHLAFNLRKRRTVGYAFANFVTHKAAMAFMDRWNGQFLADSKPEKDRRLSVDVAVVQGFDGNIWHVLSSPWVQRLTNPLLLPVVFKDGNRVDFKQHFVDNPCWSSEITGSDSWSETSLG
jgi:hypothetical protein